MAVDAAPLAHEIATVRGRPTGLEVRLRILAVGTRLPGWMDEGFADYAKRMPREMPLALTAIRPEPRGGGKPVAALKAAEAQRIEQALEAGERLIALDERGRDLTTVELAQRLEAWRQDGVGVAFIIGGPDGLDGRLLAAASERWRLSSLTLPHGLARVVLAEALYRAASLLAGHPYHRA